MTNRLRAVVVALTVGCLVAAVLPAALRGGPLPLISLAYELGVGVLFVVAGLLGWARRPDSSIGGLLTVAGLTWLMARVMLGAGDNAATFTIGLVLVLAPIAFVAHLAVAFPSGRLASRLEQFIVFGSYVVILAGVPFLDFSDCRDCPRNLLAIDSGDGVGRLLHVTVMLSTLVVIAAFSAVLLFHWRQATRAGRRVLAPVLPTALLFAIVSAAQLLAELGAPVGLGREWAWVERVAIAAIPLAFMAGLLRSHLARSGVGQLVVELGERTPGGRLSTAVARALGDPTLEIAHWSPETSTYRDGEDRAVVIPNNDGTRAVTVIERAGHRIGALVHDVALRDEPDLLDAVSAAAGLAMENERLHHEVLAQLEEVRASRSRILEAADAERRRIERNIHDGAQQRLVTVMLALSMARNRLTSEPPATSASDPEPATPRIDPCLDSLLAEAADDLGGALKELRELARGIHPPILIEEGLAAALETLAERSPVPVEVSVSANNRLSPPLEAAAYYVVSESLANVAKHAQASAVLVKVRSDDGGVRVEVIDDGVGGAMPRGGSGLEGLADRVAALDGRFVVESVPGEGTRIMAELPCG
ncbi:MAG: sensor histidine kinase [Actinomycetota bacterium]|nr:sensor histidine kinase [Actinomycetota bacterium]